MFGHRKRAFHIICSLQYNIAMKCSSGLYEYDFISEVVECCLVVKIQQNKMCHIFVDNLILTSIICSLLGDKAFIKTQPQNTTPPTAAVLKATFCSLAAAILSIIHPPDYPGNT